MLLKTFLMENK